MVRGKILFHDRLFMIVICRACPHDTNFIFKNDRFLLYAVYSLREAPGEAAGARLPALLERQVLDDDEFARRRTLAKNAGLVRRRLAASDFADERSTVRLMSDLNVAVDGDVDFDEEYDDLAEIYDGRKIVMHIVSIFFLLRG